MDVGGEISCFMIAVRQWASDTSANNQGDFPTYILIYYEHKMSREKHIPRDSDDILRHVKRAPKNKKYGIAVWSGWHKSWMPYGWYANKKARDQALAAARRRRSYYYAILGIESKYRELER